MVQIRKKRKNLFQKISLGLTPGLLFEASVTKTRFLKINFRGTDSGSEQSCSDEPKQCPICLLNFPGILPFSSFIDFTAK